MAVKIFEYAAVTKNASIVVVQTRHDFCAPQGCPTRVFVLTPAGQRRIILNTVMYPIVTDESLAELAPQLSHADMEHARRPFTLSPDGRTLTNWDRTVALDW